MSGLELAANAIQAAGTTARLAVRVATEWLAILGGITLLMAHVDPDAPMRLLQMEDTAVLGALLWGTVCCLRLLIVGRVLP